MTQKHEDDITKQAMTVSVFDVVGWICFAVVIVEVLVVWWDQR